MTDLDGMTDVINIITPKERGSLKAPIIMGEGEFLTSCRLPAPVEATSDGGRLVNQV